MNKNDDLFNKNVKIIADNGNCVEYDFSSSRLLAKRKDCNLGFSVFKFNTKGDKNGGFSLELVNKNRIIGVINVQQDGSTSSTMSLLPPTTLLSENLAYSSSNHILLTSGSETEDRQFAVLDRISGAISFQKQTPKRDQRGVNFYLEIIDSDRYGNPQTSENDLKEFLISYYSQWNAPLFKIMSPFHGPDKAIEGVPKRPRNDKPWVKKERDERQRVREMFLTMDIFFS